MKKAFHWENQTVFVTGANGFLGPWLVDSLRARGAHVVALIRDVHAHTRLPFIQQKNITFVHGDIASFETVERIVNEYAVDVVFHLGAQPLVGVAYKSPRATFTSNIQGTWNVLDAVRSASQVKAVVVASSDKAYGDCPQLPYTEETPLQGRYPYDVSKSCTDLIAQSYAHTYDVPVCITRCGNFFGGGDLHMSRIVPGTVKELLNDRPPIIRSDGSLIRDYIYVEDVVDAYITLAEKMQEQDLIGQAFNFSTQAPVSVLELVDNISKLMGKGNLKPIILNQAHSEIEAQHLDATKAQKVLDWKPSWGLTKGLEKTIRWYQTFFESQEKQAEAFSPLSVGSLNDTMSEGLL
jgi:CDP-glucose 4,6-dehydratase